MKTFDAFPEKVTYGEMYNPAMEITDQSEADAYFERLVEHTVRYFNKSLDEAKEIQRNNLGYYAGYYDHKTRRRVEKLFNCIHPVFGKATESNEPTSDEAFQAGIVLGKKTSQHE